MSIYSYQPPTQSGNPTAPKKYTYVPPNSPKNPIPLYDRLLPPKPLPRPAYPSIAPPFPKDGQSNIISVVEQIQPILVYKSECGIADFDHVKKLGEGSFGEAHLYKNKGDQQLYVIKKMSASDDVSLNEISTIREVQGVHVVRYVEYFRKDDYFYMVIEFCNGGDLDKVIKDQKKQMKKLPEGEIWFFIAQLLIALAKMHSINMLHRDIKSQNVFVSTDRYPKKLPYVVVGDFGLAKKLANALDLAKTHAGTMLYMPPELWKGLKYSSKCDIWSMGCVFYELCTLQYIVSLSTSYEQLYKLMVVATAPISLDPIAKSGYSDELRQLVSQMIQRDPDCRSTAAELLEDDGFPQLQKALKLVRKLDQQLGF